MAAEPTDIQAAEPAEPDRLADTIAPLIEAALDAGNKEKLREIIADLEDADVADVLTVLAPEQRTQLITLLGDQFPPEALAKLDSTVRDQLMEALTNAQVADVVRELDSDDAVYLLEDMAPEDQTEILAKLPADDRQLIERGLTYPEESAGRLMQSDFIAVPPYWTVGQVIDHMRDTDELPDRFSEIFLVDPAYHLVGTVHLDRLLRSKRPVAVQAIKEEDMRSISVALDQEEVARQFDRYGLLSLPVVDENARLVGVVTADDVVEIVKEEAEEDIYRLAGVGDETVSDTVFSIARGRFLWLFVNLLTAILASFVISRFGATIQQMVALAFLMPIVASMGGNAGTQTMTVTVRSLATRSLSRVNAVRVIGRECAVGILNGLFFSVVMGAIAVLWFGSTALGLVIGAALIINLIAAALAGILIPLALDAKGVDPAIASSAFVTTVTDVVGFLSFLGLASLWLVK